MNEIIAEIREIVSTYATKCASLSEEDFSSKPNPAKWSKKEVLGHLIDSAQNNLRRFITGQYAAQPPHIIYDQDFWVKAGGYQQTPAKDVIHHWVLINDRICAVLGNMPAASYTKTVNTGHTKDEFHTLQWLAEDYVRHMKHHLNQIFTGAFDVVYV